jgi:hypothetical protein
MHSGALAVWSTASCTTDMPDLFGVGANKGHVGLAATQVLSLLIAFWNCVYRKTKIGSCQLSDGSCKGSGSSSTICERWVLTACTGQPVERFV